MCEKSEGVLCVRAGGKQAMAGEPRDMIYKVEGQDEIRGRGGVHTGTTTEPIGENVRERSFKCARACVAG